VALLFSVPTWAEANKQEEPETVIVEEIIAKINGAIVTRTDLTRTRAQLETSLERQNLPAARVKELISEEEPHILRNRIDHLLLVQRGEQLDIDVEQDVSRHIANLMLQTKVADQDEFAKLVREQTGQRFEDYRQEITDSIMTRRVLHREIGSRISIPHDEIVTYYNEHKDDFMRDERVFLREILISTNDMEGDEIAGAKEKAEALVERARRGEKFDELARDNSDAITADNGGDLGGWQKKDLRDELVEQIWDKDRNYVTDPIETDSGFLILKVIEHHQAGLAHIEEVENEITDQLYQREFEPLIREYLTELRQQAYLEIKEGFVDSGAAPGKDTSWTDPAELVPETVTREEVVRKRRHKRLLFIPIPGTRIDPTSTSRN
jgi:parvulin-like peptidyl-prolyl isomerase